MNPEVTNSSLSFSFLLVPKDIIINCLARISRSYYPKLSLVCKTFRSLLLSIELRAERYHLKTYESVFNVCLQLSSDLPPSWFSLWINPEQTLTNDIGKKKKKKSTGNTLLVPAPSCYLPRTPMFIVTVGSEYYALFQNNHPSPVLLVCDKDFFWREGPIMTVARERAVMGVLDGKIYVMGGCEANETANWAEVFDLKSQTWEPLPDPGAEIRFSRIKTIEGFQGKLYLRCNEEKDYVYDTKQEWRVIRGLAMLNGSRHGDFVEIANYHGKLLILWDKFEHRGHCQSKNIWCTVIACERRNVGDDDVWGNIEWASVVLTVPSSYVFLRSRLSCF
ncbi:putative F-box/kelch-repeat protein At5g28160 [Eutrema salsugineum]|uniref:putative F-box/kelch-repeat protein At5g28160 n=1 Tax=Eutrema salsugineum TaxID=72664 RepID=UPI000CED2D4C|nr:putative F-box/kelch-repeat protein At5g28160 [Eutrema salsugineum]